jgi:hypothetical protein
LDKKNTTKKAAIVEETKQIIAQYKTRLTIRQIYYRLVSKHIISNTSSQYKYLVKILVDARWNRQIPFNVIEDRTRQFIGEDYELVAPKDYFQQWLSAFKECQNFHSLPVWLEQETYVEVWLEKQALQGIFQEVTDQWKITLFPCRGYPSLTKIYESARRIKNRSNGKPVEILYFGDYDPSGEDIIRAIENNLSGFDIEFEIRKIAILDEQISEYNIPPMPAKTSDPRYARFIAEHGEDAVELDAIDPDDLKQIIENSITERFDQTIRETIEARQIKERKQIGRMISKVLKK